MNILHDKSQNCNASSNLKKSTSLRISEPLNHPKKTISYSIWVFFRICAPHRAISSGPEWRSLSPLVFEVARCPRNSAVGRPECPTWIDIYPFRIPSPGISWDKRIPSSKLTYQWKIPIFNRKYIFNPGIFQPAMLNLPECFCFLIKGLRFFFPLKKKNTTSGKSWGIWVTKGHRRRGTNSPWRPTTWDRPWHPRNPP